MSFQRRYSDSPNSSNVLQKDTSRRSTFSSSKNFKNSPMDASRHPSSSCTQAHKRLLDETISIQEIIYNVRDAVVNISGQIILTSSDQSDTGSTINPTTITEGNGFFIKGHYIICPASLVLIAPTLLQTHGRFPPYPGIPTNSNYPNTHIRVSKILVTISNVNGCDQTPDTTYPKDRKNLPIKSSSKVEEIYSPGTNIQESSVTKAKSTLNTTHSIEHKSDKTSKETSPLPSILIPVLELPVEQQIPLLRAGALLVKESIHDQPKEKLRATLKTSIAYNEGISAPPGRSYSYEADLVGVDAASNIAVLCINMTHKWNRHNPPIRACHPFLQWGKSRNVSPGDTVILIGETSSPDTIGINSLMPNISKMLTNVTENGVAIGNIADNRYVSYGGKIPGELLLLSNILTHGFQQGLPIITLNGTVIGMFLHVNSLSSYNVALSEFFMRRPVKALIRSFIDNNIPENYKGFVEAIPDPIGSYYRFNKGWLGLGGILINQNDYNTHIRTTKELTMQSDPQSNSINISRYPILNNGEITHGPDCKEIIGYRILAIAGMNGITGFFIPGLLPKSSLSESIVNSMKSNEIEESLNENSERTPTPKVELITPQGLYFPDLISSPLCGIISIGDIITHINGCPLGDRKRQISPALVMWRVRPGNTVTLRYRKQSENFELFHEITTHTKSYEPFLDFPWYSMTIPVPLETMMPTLI